MTTTLAGVGLGVLGPGAADVLGLPGPCLTPSKLTSFLRTNQVRENETEKSQTLRGLGAIGPQGELGGREALLGLPPGRAHIRILPPVATAHSGRNRAGRHWLPVIVRHDWFIPYVTPSALHRFSLKRKCERKNSHPNPGGVFAPAFTLASFFAHAPVSGLWVLTRGPFFVSTHVDDPTTGVDTLGGGRFDFDGERPTEWFIGGVFGWSEARVCGWVGFVDYPGVRSWLVEAGRKKEGGKERTRYLDSSLYVHGSQRLNFPLETWFAA